MRNLVLIFAVIIQSRAQAANVPGYSRLYELYECTYAVTKAYNANAGSNDLVPMIMDLCSKPLARIESVDPHFESLTLNRLLAPMTRADRAWRSSDHYFSRIWYWMADRTYARATLHSPQVIEDKLRAAAASGGF